MNENVLVRHPLSAARIADAAVWALREEALLTPKPGLVDQRGSGAHLDMDLPLLLRSAAVLRPMFTRIADCSAQTSIGPALRERLGAIGRAGEARMLAATGGVNTHRGAIWTLGLLAAASASLDATTFDVDGICILAGTIARLPTAASTQPSHGCAMFLRHGARGARGEAQDGFPNVRNIALPALRAARAQHGDESLARLETLIALIANVDDTCLLFRGGRSALAIAQNGARRVLAAGIDTARGQVALGELDGQLIELNASPGGSADLLAAALFLDRLIALMEAPYGNA